MGLGYRLRSSLWLDAGQDANPSSAEGAGGSKDTEVNWREENGSPQVPSWVLSDTVPEIGSGAECWGRGHARLGASVLVLGL